MFTIQHRNKSRVVKYSQRGFKAFLVDPYDSNDIQNVACDAFIPTKPSFHPQGDSPYSKKDEDRDTTIRIQKTKMEEGKSRVFCCHTYAIEDRWGTHGNDDGNRKLGVVKDWFMPKDMEGYDARLIPYTMKLFETAPDAAIEYFSQRFKWTEEDKRLVQGIDPYLRMACYKCKNVSELFAIA